MKEIDHKALLCDEHLFPSSPTTPKQEQKLLFGCFSPDPNANLQEEEVEELLRDHLRREKEYIPCNSYWKELELSTNLHTARSKAVQYVIHICMRLRVATTTAFHATNYIDRFLSMNSCMKWEIWMVELLGITCVSLACKFYETCLPSLYDLQQIEDLEHRFKATTIQEMELTVLKALDWRLSCVTAFNFANLLLGPTRSGSMHDKLTCLLLHSLLDPSIIKFKASVIATSALICATKGNDAEITRLNKIHVDEMDHVVNCTKILETHLLAMDTQNDLKQWSPVSVILTKHDCLV